MDSLQVEGQSINILSLLFLYNCDFWYNKIALLLNKTKFCSKLKGTLLDIAAVSIFPSVGSIIGRIGVWDSGTGFIA